jgi:hypothetical protein
VRTLGGGLLGSPGYLAPEQVNGDKDEIDQRTDQFSLAAIAYEMLTGHRLFDGDNLAAIIYSLLNDPPPQVDNLSPEIQQVLHRALAKNKRDRFANVGDFSKALAHAAGLDSDAATPGPHLVSPVVESGRLVTPPRTEALSPDARGAVWSEIGDRGPDSGPGRRRVATWARSFGLLVSLALAGGGSYLAFGGRPRDPGPSESPTSPRTVAEQPNPVPSTMPARSSVEAGGPPGGGSEVLSTGTPDVPGPPAASEKQSRRRSRRTQAAAASGGQPPSQGLGLAIPDLAQRTGVVVDIPQPPRKGPPPRDSRLIRGDEL